MLHNTLSLFWEERPPGWTLDPKFGTVIRDGTSREVRTSRARFRAFLCNRCNKRVACEVGWAWSSGGRRRNQSLVFPLWSNGRNGDLRKRNIRYCADRRHRRGTRRGYPVWSNELGWNRFVIASCWRWLEVGDGDGALVWRYWKCILLTSAAIDRVRGLGSLIPRLGII